MRTSADSDQRLWAALSKGLTKAGFPNRSRKMSRQNSKGRPSRKLWTGPRGLMVCRDGQGRFKQMCSLNNPDVATEAQMKDLVGVFHLRPFLEEWAAKLNQVLQITVIQWSLCGKNCIKLACFAAEERNKLFIIFVLGYTPDMHSQRKAIAKISQSSIVAHSLNWLSVCHLKSLYVI